MSNDQRSEKKRTGRRAVSDALWRPDRDGRHSAVPPAHRSVLQALMERRPIDGWDATTWTVTDVTWAQLASWIGLDGPNTANTVKRLVRDLNWNKWLGGTMPTRARAGTFTLFVPEDPRAWERSPDGAKERDQSADRARAAVQRAAEAEAERLLRERATAAYGNDQLPHTAVESGSELPYAATELPYAAVEPAHTAVANGVFPAQRPDALGWVGVGSKGFQNPEEQAQPGTLRSPDPSTSAPDALDHPASPDPGLRPGPGLLNGEADRLPGTTDDPVGLTATIPACVRVRAQGSAEPAVTLDGLVTQMLGTAIFHTAYGTGTE